MAKTLKLGFAMGGGVSLGSFCGAALTESIKLALLFARDDDGNPFDRVEIDVFAGASAGAMSLGIMLNALAFPSKDVALRKKAAATLRSLYGLETTWKSLPDKKRQQLIDAQLAQDKMNDIWINQITLDSLLNPEGSASIPPLKYQCGLVNRKTVADIATANLLPAGGAARYLDEDKATHPLLATRVLYGCSISNLNPLHAKASKLYPVASGSEVVINDALTSFQHKEMRIFDINFAPVSSKKLSDTDKHPDRWMRLHWGDSISGKTFDIRSATDWKHIVATAIASGAFPVAFEPVTLKRYKWEYPSSIWPFGDASNGNFTYVDGGVFNNEPVAEAFRLASHIDGLDDDINYVRRIVFVDPNVGSKPEYRLPGLADWQTQEAFGGPFSFLKSFDGNDLLRKTSLDKLLGQLSTLATVSSAQASAKEEHRTFQVANRLILRNQLRESLNGAIKPDSANFVKLKKAITAQLQELSKKDPIPTLPSTIKGEILRLANEKDSVVSSLADPALAAQIESNTSLSAFSDEQQSQIMTALVFSFVDIISGLSAKSRNSQLIAIGPFKRVKKNQFEKLFLPGSPLAAFSGFMSTIPSQYEADTARFCTAEFMRHAGMIAAKTHHIDEPVPFDKQHPQYYPYMADFKAGLTALAARIEQLIESSHLLNLGVVNAPVLNALAGFIKGKIKDMEYEQVEEDVLEFRVPVADGDFELDGKNRFDDDRHPIRLSQTDAQLYLVCFARWDRKHEVWSGYNVKNGELIIDRDGFFSDTDGYYRLTLPSLAQIEAARQLGYPVFWGQKVLKEKKSRTNPLTQYWSLRNELVPFSELL
ncbi:hypothetical protein [Alteromonas sp. CYL-A6]|uniref:hypothetical protein n=1 Tax=Alteromonas nitratireducens TaxID=3390813 RepID=UPI0034AC5031